MIKDVKISVVTVCYNAANTIEETIKSVSGQTYKRVEYIIIDGKSSDGTQDIISKYSTSIAYWISEPDLGIYDAMNKALKVATGDFLIFMGADDIFYDNNVISRVVSKICSIDAIYYGDVIFKTRKKTYPGKITSSFDLARRNFCHQALFYCRKSYASKNYNLKYKNWADYVYNLELYGGHKYKFLYLDMVVSIFNDNGSSQNGDKQFMKDRFKILCGCFNPFLAIVVCLGYQAKKWLK